MPLVLKVKKLNNSAILPSQPYQGDAGFDLYTNEEVTLKPGERIRIKTGIALSIPEGYVGLIWDKSSVGVSRGVTTLGGVIDSGYRGEITVGVINLSGEKQTFEKGDKVAQILIQKYEQVLMEEVEELGKTERDKKGFGSSGK